MVLPPVIDVIFGVVHEINHSAIWTMWTPGAASQGRRAWTLVLGMGSWILSWLYDIWIYTNQLYIFFFARLSKIGNGNVFCSVILMHQSWHKPFDSRFSCQRNRQICRSATLCCAFIAIHRCGVWGLRVDKNPAPQRICLGCRIEKHPKNINKNLIHVSLLKSFSTVSEAICNSATGGPSPVAWRLQVWLLGHFGCDTSAQQPLLDRQVSCTGSDVAAVGGGWGWYW